MNCPNCGAFAYEDNLGRWFCSQSCGWNSGYVGGSHGMSKVRCWHAAVPVRRVAVRKLRVAVRGSAGLVGGSLGK